MQISSIVIGEKVSAARGEVRLLSRELRVVNHDYTRNRLEPSPSSNASSSHTVDADLAHWGSFHNAAALQKPGSCCFHLGSTTTSLLLKDKVVAVPETTKGA